MSAMKRKSVPALDLDADAPGGAPQAAVRATRRPEPSREDAPARSSTRPRKTDAAAKADAPRKRKAAAGLAGAPGQLEDELSAVMARLAKVRPEPASRKAAPILAAEREPPFASLLRESERRLKESTTKTAAALDSVAEWMERAETRLNEANRLSTERQDRTTEVLGEALHLLTRRLDDIDRKVAQGQTPSMDATLQAIERLDARLSEIDATRDSQGSRHVEAVLAGFENRIAELSDRIIASTPRPLGRRGHDPREEVTSAVAEIRQRQRELDRADAAPARAARTSAAPRSHADVIAALRADVTDLARRVEGSPGTGEDSRAVGLAILHAEMEGLREAIGRLATRDEVGGLEQTLADVSSRLAMARGPDDVLAVSGPIEQLEAEIRRLSDLVATGVHGKLAHDVERLVKRIDAIAGAGIDPAALDGFERQLGEIRRALADMAGPQRVQGLAVQVSELMTERLDALSQRMADGRTDASASRIEELSRKVDRLSDGRALEDAACGRDGSADGVERLLDKLDRLEESLRRPASGPDIKPLEDLVRTLADRLDRAGRPDAGQDTLDALERQVSVLAQRLERDAGRDPALAALEHTMGDLMAEVATLREGAVEAVERAAKNAVATTLSGLPDPHRPAEIGGLERDLADLKATHSAVGERTQGSLDALHGTLETVVARITSLEGDLVRDREPAAAESARATASEAAPKAGAVKISIPKSGSDRLAEAVRGSEAPAKSSEAVPPEADRPLAPRSEEILLEPGSGRPRPNAAGVAAKSDAEPGDVKASFIAAARRAAQAAAAEAASRGAKPGGLSADLGLKGGPGAVAARVKAAIDKRRRPLLLGLAAIVLAIGALQAGHSLIASKAPVATAMRADPAPARTAPVEPRSETSTPDAPKSGAELSDPRTTQSIAPAAKAAPSPDRLVASADPAPSVGAATEASRQGAPSEPARSEAKADPAPVQLAPPAPSPTGGEERIANVASVGEVPTIGIPTGLRQAALAGDPAAVYELAARIAEGRGTARDPKLAAKLFERAALHGLAPAQYRVGNHYEKGIGVGRDLALAKLWYERAAERGNARAMHNLAVLLAEGAAGGRPDYAAAVGWFRKAADQGVRDSQFNLAVLLARGLGTAQDLRGSYTWFSIAAAGGDADSAKKRDEVGTKMAPADLATAKSAAERWRAETPSKAANEIAIPANGWAEQAPPAAAKKSAGTKV